MVFIVDRRKNPSNNITNRQKFIKRAKEQIRQAVKNDIKNRSISDIKNADGVKVPVKDLEEHSFEHNHHEGFLDRVLPGNKTFNKGDKIKKPQEDGGGGKSNKASDSGEGEDEFTFTLTRDEFMDIFFDDLELPNMIKKSLQKTLMIKKEREGFTNVGNPCNMDIRQSSKNALARRLALKRPKNSELEELMELLQKEKNKEKRDILIEQIEKIKRKMKAIPWIDPIDIRFRHFDNKPKPTTQAVMFCILDVSGSMTEHHKDLSKRFFMLMHLFLEYNYDKIDIVFIKHTTEAKEVDEHEFFYSRETGGTAVSSAINLTNTIISQRYDLSSWNIYITQCSDGDNFSSDNHLLLKEMKILLPNIQYFAFLNVANSQRDDFHNALGLQPQVSDLWKLYSENFIEESNFSMVSAYDAGDIFTVFRKLFKKKELI